MEAAMLENTKKNNKNDSYILSQALEYINFRFQLQFLKK